MYRTMLNELDPGGVEYLCYNLYLFLFGFGCLLGLGLRQLLHCNPYQLTYPFTIFQFFFYKKTVFCTGVGRGFHHIMNKRTTCLSWFNKQFVITNEPKNFSIGIDTIFPKHFSVGNVTCVYNLVQNVVYVFLI